VASEKMFFDSAAKVHAVDLERVHSQDHSHDRNRTFTLQRARSPHSSLPVRSTTYSENSRRLVWDPATHSITVIDLSKPAIGDVRACEHRASCRGSCRPSPYTEGGLKIRARPRRPALPRRRSR
jgi:hypothetical protein